MKVNISPPYEGKIYMFLCTSSPHYCEKKFKIGKLKCSIVQAIFCYYPVQYLILHCLWLKLGHSRAILRMLASLGTTVMVLLYDLGN